MEAKEQLLQAEEPPQPDPQWNDWKWQYAHRITTVDQLKKVLPLSMQEQGSASHGWWSWLEGCAAYRDVSAGERESIVRHMIDNDILVDADVRRFMAGVRASGF